MLIPIQYKANNELYEIRIIKTSPKSAILTRFFTKSNHILVKSGVEVVEEVCIWTSWFKSHSVTWRMLGFILERTKETSKRIAQIKLFRFLLEIGLSA